MQDVAIRQRFRGWWNEILSKKNMQQPHCNNIRKYWKNKILITKGRW